MSSMTLELTPQGTQLTIGGLVAALDELPGGILIQAAGFGNNGVPHELSRHRTKDHGVVIRTRYERAPFMTVDRFKLMLIQHGSQPVTKFNPTPATMDSPLWVGGVLALEFRAVTGVEALGDSAYIRWVDVAPVQGPALQRIPDVEVLRRNAELAGRTDPNLDPESPGNRWLLEHMPKERDRARVRLSEARTALEKITREVASLEATTADYDYTLGLTDVNPRFAEGVRS